MTVRWKVLAPAGLITLDRPAQLNPIDSAVLAGLDAAVDALVADPSVRAILITGAGRAFSAGGDLKAYIELQTDPVAFPAFVTELHRVFGRLREIPVPVIALVNGVTAAGGLELLLNCDVALAAQSAQIGDGHLNFGMMGGGGVLTLLRRFVGIQRARELMLSGRLLGADEAASWGLVSRVVPDDRLLDAGQALAADIAAKSPLAVANAKEVMHAIWASGDSVDAGLRLERERNAFYCLTSSDAREGLAAFAEKRPPRFTGR
ncbi:MAG: enoyl-CoA hydratase/isomerase family protein [Acidimicrobiales bacterium]